MFKAGDALSKLVQVKCTPDGGLEAESPVTKGYGVWGGKHPAAGRFFVTFWKKTILMPLNHILHVFRAIWQN